MSFSFSFSGDDIEEDTTSDSITHTQNNASTQEDTLTTKFQNTTLTPTLIHPKPHTLAELLTALPSQISYNYLDIPLHHTIVPQPRNNRETETNGNGETSDTKIRIPRRSLFDIRQQLMAESDPANTDDQTGNLLTGLETGDLTSGIYEGGFKTWECAVDLAGFVSNILDESDSRPVHVIELGAGSAVPTLVLLVSIFRNRTGDGRRVRKGKGRVRFTLCDYNEDVLRLATAVNIFLVTTIAIQKECGQIVEDEEADIEIDEEDVRRVLMTLTDIGVEVDFVSGAWGKKFVQLVRGETESRDTRLLLLASETIYSPESLCIFSETVLDILKSTEEEKKAYVAAKKVYFGVGGGVQEFEEQLTRLGGTTGTVLDVKGAGVGRVILEVSTR